MNQKNGIGFVEIILTLAIVVGLVYFFNKKQSQQNIKTETLLQQAGVAVESGATPQQQLERIDKHMKRITDEQKEKMDCAAGYSDSADCKLK